MKKGFTLIELLAVIIILAIIALIATPIVLDVINDAKSEANKETVYGLIAAGRYYYAESMTDEIKKNNIKNNVNIYNDIMVNGKKPEKGSLFINNEGQVSVSVIIDNKCYMKTFTGDLQEFDTIEECGLIEEEYKVPVVNQKVKDLTIGTLGYYSEDLYIKIDITDNSFGIKGYRKCVSDTECEPSEDILSINEEILVTDNNYVCVIGIDNNDVQSEKSCVNYKFDKTKPTATMTLSSDNYGEIKIVVTASDLETNISKYEYSVDNGQTWKTNEENPSQYTFTGLETENNDILVRVTNGANGYIELSDSLTIMPANIVFVDSVDVLVSLMNKEVKGYYYFTNDIDFTGVTWNPISKLEGTINGNNKKITNFESSNGGLINSFSGTVKDLTIENPNVSNSIINTGVIANSTTSNTELKNVHVIGGDVLSTESNVGGLIGSSTGTALNITDSSSTANVEGGADVGGIVGGTWTKVVTITNSYSKANVTGNGTYTGGLVGRLGNATVNNCYATGTVTGTEIITGGLIGYGNSVTINDSYVKEIIINGKSNVGGLIGKSEGSNIKKSYAKAEVISSEGNAGGLIGNLNRGTIIDSYATGNVTGNMYVGGLIGNLSGANITNSYATGNVLGSGTNIGGLIAYSYNSAITNCYSIGDITNTGSSVGGLIGYIYGGTVNNSYAKGNIIDGTDRIGGLIGQTNGTLTISGSYAEGNVNASGNYVGGLIGQTFGTSTVDNSHAIGTVNGGDQVGGLIGNSNGTIDNSYATGPVIGNAQVGGLIGSSNSTINNSHATGDVTGNETHIGGLVGQNLKDISNSYATGNVTTTYAPTSVTPTYLGGLVGTGSNITNCYATGNVTGGNENNKFLGGFGGSVDASKVTNCYSLGKVINGTDIDAFIGGSSTETGLNNYFVTTTSGFESSLYATPITDGGKTAASYVGFDFENVWIIQEGVTYPTLR